MGQATASSLENQNAKPATSPSFWKKASARLIKNRLGILSLAILVAFSIIAVLSIWFTPKDPYAVNILYPHEGPSSEHWLGTDESGRDVLSRLIAGARISMTVGFASMAISIVLGVLIGAVAGYFGGWLDALLMRFTDAMLAIPYFFLVLIVVSAFGPSFRNIVVVIGLVAWMPIARIVYGDVLRFRNQEFVTAAESIGASNARLLFRHVLPHAVPSLIVAATLGIAYAILLESALSYLGLGIQPPMASWGNMLSKSQAYLFDNPILPLYPGLCILIVVVAFNFLGDALRDALDPRG